MIQIPTNAKIFVIHEAINFRYGIDGTAGVVRILLEKEPMDGAFFVFRNKLGHSLRVLHYDGSGFWLATKRLSTGTFNKVWPKGDGSGGCAPLLARELQILIWAGDATRCGFPDLWRRIA